MRFKKVVAFLIFVWFLVPFVFITDLYPFFRYGMFAEPIKAQQTTEMLQLWCKPAHQPLQPFRSQEIGLTENHFGYVLRHYFYSQKIEQLFRQIHEIKAKKQTPTIEFWQLRKLQITPKHTDSLVVAEWKP